MFWIAPLLGLWNNGSWLIKAAEGAIPRAEVLSPLLRRGERKKKPRAEIFAGRDDFRR